MNKHNRDVVKNGLDPEGYIINSQSIDNIQDIYQPAIDTVLNELKNLLPQEIHSIYLYGSVGRGTAKPYQSDLDICIIFHQPLVGSINEKLRNISQSIRAHYPFVAKMEFDCAHLKQCLEDEYFEWQFWIKHCCCWLYGIDLTDTIPRYKPTVALGLAINADLQERITDTVKNVSAESTSELSKSMAKKMIRTAYSLLAEQDNSWYENIEDMVTVIRKKIPEYSVQIDQCCYFIASPNNSRRSLQKLLESFGETLVRHMDNLRRDLASEDGQ